MIPLAPTDCALQLEGSTSRNGAVSAAVPTGDIDLGHTWLNRNFRVS